uniref:RING-type domain-containing protein n=1 Tax=Oryzias latipes TaxID=8090 RepID=A0A3P9IES8_ORYLA
MYILQNICSLREWYSKGRAGRGVCGGMLLSPENPPPSSPSRPYKSSVVSQLECSVCCSTFDNIFRTPKLLDCTHTFCLECLSRLRTISPAPQVLNGESKHLTCPICRRPTTLPPEGPPALTTNLAVLCQLPRHQQQEEPVWLEGKRLFCKSSKGGSGPESAVCVYIGESKAVGGPLQTNQQYEQMDRRSKYKKSVFCVLFVLFKNCLMCVRCFKTLRGETVTLLHHGRCSADNAPTAERPASLSFIVLFSCSTV